MRKFLNKWSPLGDLFCAVYGFMPAKATLYNVRGDVMFDYGTGPRNCCFFNQHSSLLMLAGFGNLRGDVEHGIFIFYIGKFVPTVFS